MTQLTQAINKQLTALEHEYTENTNLQRRANLPRMRRDCPASTHHIQHWRDMDKLRMRSLWYGDERKQPLDQLPWRRDKKQLTTLEHDTITDT